MTFKRWQRCFYLGLCLVLLPLIGSCGGFGSGDLQGVEVGNPSVPTSQKNVLIVPNDGSPSYRVILSGKSSKISEISRFSGPLPALEGAVARPIYGEAVF